MTGEVCRSCRWYSFDRTECNALPSPHLRLEEDPACSLFRLPAGDMPIRESLTVTLPCALCGHSKHDHDDHTSEGKKIRACGWETCGCPGFQTIGG